MKWIFEKKTAKPIKWTLSLEKNGDFVVRENETEIARFVREDMTFRTIAIRDFRDWTKATNVISAHFQTAEFEK